MENSKQSIWEISPEFYSKLNFKVLEEILKDGQLRFQEINSEIKDVRNKAYTLIAILISFLGLLITNLLKNTEGIGSNDYKIIYLLIMFALGITIWKIIELIKIVFPKSQMALGEEPKIIDYIVMTSTNPEHQEFAYLINRVENIQTKISFNESILQTELSIHEDVIRVISITYIVLLIISIIIIII